MCALWAFPVRGYGEDWSATLWLNPGPLGLTVGPDPGFSRSLGNLSFIQVHGGELA